MSDDKIVSDDKKPTRSLAGIAGIVAIATLLSKFAGLIRQLAIAAAFGLGVAADAYSYAYIVPGFFFVLLGGINGPFYNAIVSVIAKRKQEEIAPLVETVNTIVSGCLLLLTIGMIIFAAPIVDIFAPGLSTTETGQITREIAIQQFQVMAPLAIVSGLIGIGFGTLNAADQYWLPSISPMLSSVAVLVGLGGLVWQLGERITQPEYALLGGLVLAWSTLVGGVLQWLIQVPAQWRSGLGRLRLRFNLRQPGVKEVMQVLGPATLSSGMLQINVATDLFFASRIPGAAAALGNAGLLVQTPLGIMSNVVLVPLMPVFSRLTDPQNWGELKLRIRQGMIMTALTMMGFSAIFIALALPIVRVVYERYAFNQRDSLFVTEVFIAYAIGMFVYLGRDVLLRVFYALGDATTPFRISVINIILNAVFDYFLIQPFGAAGIVLATVAVNLISMVWFLILLDRRLQGIPWRDWWIPIGQIALISTIAGVACWLTRWGLELTLGTEGFLIQLVQLAIASGVGLGVFAVLVSRLGLPEVEQLMAPIRRRLGR